MKKICIDMDYSSDPIWIQEEDDYWVNDSLHSYSNDLSREVMHSLCIYQQLWETVNWSNYKSPTSSSLKEYPGEFIVHNTLDVLSQSIAYQIKKEQPTWRVFYCTSESYERIEVK